MKYLIRAYTRTGIFAVERNAKNASAAKKAGMPELKKMAFGKIMKVTVTENK